MVKSHGGQHKKNQDDDTFDKMLQPLLDSLQKVKRANQSKYICAFTKDMRKNFGTPTEDTVNDFLRRNNLDICD